MAALRAGPRAARQRGRRAQRARRDGAAAADAHDRRAAAERVHPRRHRHPEAVRRAAAVQAVGARHHHEAHAQAAAARDRAVMTATVRYDVMCLVHSRVLSFGSDCEWVARRVFNSHEIGITICLEGAIRALELLRHVVCSRASTFGPARRATCATTTRDETEGGARPRGGGPAAARARSTRGGPRSEPDPLWALARGYLSLCRFFTAAVWCVPALRVPLVHSLINHFRQKRLM